MRARSEANVSSAANPAERTPRTPRKPTKVDVIFTITLALASLWFIFSQRSEAKLIHVEKFGLEKTVEGSQPPSVLLIPGLSNGGDVWDGVVASLKDEYALHVVTLAGFAGTEPVASEGPFLMTVRDALIEYIERENLDRPAVVGHSLGGFLAYWIAATASDQVGAVVAVDGLPFLGALQNPAATPDSMRPMADQMTRMFETMSLENYAQQNRLALGSMIRNNDEVERVAASSGRSDPATVGKAMNELMTTDLRGELSKIKAPVLLIGAFGALPTEEARNTMKERYEAQISAAPRKVFVAADTLHFVMLDDEKFFLDTLEAFFAESWLPELQKPDFQESGARGPRK